MSLRVKFLLIVYLIMTIVIFTLPYYTAEGYFIQTNTTSQLGAQNTPNAWVMNLTFILLGVTSIWAGWKHYQGYVFHKILLVCFGLALLLTAFFSHAPISESIEYSQSEDDLHSVFASITGFAFTLLAISTGFIKKKTKQMLLPIGIGLLASLLSMLMFKVEEFTGIWQRLIFLISFAWMIYEFNLQLD